MKRKIIYLLLSFLSVSSYAQISFVKGYLINNNGEKIECLIKVDWTYNPTEFDYKLSENTDFKTAPIDSVLEFGILDKTIYRRFIVKIDRSSELEDYISASRNPEFNEEKLFLKVLVEGKAKLYLYTAPNLTRFFSQVDSGDINQLVFKSFKASENTVEQNQMYKQQLFISLICPQFSRSYFTSIRYSPNDLIKCFVAYNKCSNSGYTVFEKKQRRDLFNFTFRPTACISSFRLLDTRLGSEWTTFNSELGSRIGIEAEYIMPFNKNKWTLLFEPTFQSYKSEKLVTWRILIAKADFKSIEFPIGIRYYSYLNRNSKIFYNASVVLDYEINSKIIIGSRSLDVSPLPSIALGLGYEYKNKYSIELKYGIKRDILYAYDTWSSKFRIFSLGIGYSIF